MRVGHSVTWYIKDQGQFPKEEYEHLKELKRNYQYEEAEQGWQKQYEKYVAYCKEHHVVCIRSLSAFDLNCRFVFGDITVFR